MEAALVSSLRQQSHAKPPRASRARIPSPPLKPAAPPMRLHPAWTALSHPPALLPVPGPKTTLQNEEAALEISKKTATGPFESLSCFLDSRRPRRLKPTSFHPCPVASPIRVEDPLAEGLGQQTTWRSKTRSRTHARAHARTHTHTHTRAGKHKHTHAHKHARACLFDTRATARMLESGDSDA